MEKRTLRRIGVFSAAKMQGFVGFVIGLILGIIYAIGILTFGVLFSSMMSRASDVSPLGGIGAGVVGAIVAVVAFPIFYGIVCFIAGAIGAVIYNAAARFMGGIEVEFEVSGPEYSAPPQPQPWAGQYAPGQ